MGEIRASQEELRRVNIVLPYFTLEDEADFNKFLKTKWLSALTVKYNWIASPILLVDPEYQKEAEQRHRELAAKAGGFNDFATLAVIFEQCKSRYVR